MPDLKLALRALLKAPFVNFVAIVSLALGIGANGAIFSLFDQMLMRKLPVPEVDQLVNLGAPGPKPGSTSCNQAGDCEQVFSYPMFRDLEEQQQVFSGIAGHRSFGANLGYAGKTQMGEGMLVSGGYFSTLGLQPAVGRLLDRRDDAAIGEARVVVLSHDYWRSRFGGDASVVGQALVVNGEPLQIVGVGPASFRGTTLGSRAEIFVPMTLRDALSAGFNDFDDRRSYWIYAFARLAPGVEASAAAATLNGPYRAILQEVEAPLQEGMSEQTLTRFLAREITVEAGARGQSSLLEDARAPLFLLFIVAGVVLLIACANVANLLLARSASRSGEMAVRLSIGGSRGRIVLQLLTEACMLALLAGAVSLLVARGTLLFIGSMLPPEAMSTVTLQLDLRMVAFAAALALATGLLFGLFPALQSTRIDLASTLKGTGGQRSAGRGAARFRTALVVAQIALSTTLLISAALFTRSLDNISRVDLGLEIENLVTFGISPERNGYDPERSRALFARTEQELAALPGVTGVTSSLVPLLAGSNWGSSVRVQGFDADPDTDTHSRFNQVGPGYFRTMGISLLAGREFTPADTVGSPKVVVVNEAFAEKFGLGREAVGSRMANGEGTDLPLEIVGLVQDAKYSEVKGAIPPLFFAPVRQNERLGFVSFYVRTSLDAGQSLRSVAAVMAKLDPDLPVEELKTMPQQVRENVAVDRIITLLSSAFAGLATLLAAIGLYGVLAYSVSQRTREIGLRMALGADAARVRLMVLRQVGVLALVGGSVGLLAAVGVGSLAGSLLFEVKGHDPLALVGGTLLLALVALASGFLPAVRASRVAPMKALRWE
jgi:predicted permease